MQSTPDSWSTCFAEALSLLGAHADVVAVRPVGGEAPPWVDARGWRGWLGSLGDDELALAEVDPARYLATRASGSLRELGRRAAALARPYRDESAPPAAALDRHVKLRKQAQVDAFALEAEREFAEVRRIVDLGAGHGHLTRALGERLGCEAIGLDWDPDRVARARQLGGAANFVAADGTAAAGDHSPTVEVRPGDLVVGLHPCGSLGDALVRRAREAGADVLAVSCCFQKQASPVREAVSETGRAAGFRVPKAALGLANLAQVSFDGGGSLARKGEWRRTRVALRVFLEARGLSLGPGDESRGVPKERVRRGLAEVAGLACASRGLAPPTDDELVAASEQAEHIGGQIARFALPRHALARVLELAIVMDRASLLAEAGYRVDVRAIFSARTSPRNLAIVAHARR